MRIVVTDTSPINYLVQAGHVEVLGLLFESVILPEAVMRELRHDSAPEVVRRWTDLLPEWVSVKICHTRPSFAGLDPGETEAIGIALELGIETVIMDERKGRRVAMQMGLKPIGTLALLELGDENGVCDFDSVVSHLIERGFHISDELVTLARRRLQKRRQSP